MAAPETPEELRIGPDLVRIENGFVVIYSPRYMENWSVREFCRQAIWFQDHKFYLHARERVSGPRLWKYSLALWPDGESQSPTGSITYSAEYVAERDAVAASEKARSSVGLILLPLSPFLGFLWSGTKARLEPLGIAPRMTTFCSLTLQFGCVLLLGIYIGYLGGWSVANVLLLGLLSLDLVYRYDAHLRDEGKFPGFLEWCVRRG